VFKALTRHSAPAQYLTADLKPHQAVVKIPDARLDKLVELVKPRSIVNATCEFMDIPGFDPGSTERKLKTAVLEHYRRCDALALVVNLWEPENERLSTPQGEASSLLEELVLLDLVTAENAIARTEKAAKHKSDKDAEAKYAALKKVHPLLEQGTALRAMELEPQEDRALRDLALLSAKPVIVVLNVADDAAREGVDVPGLGAVMAPCAAQGLSTIRMAARLEAELSEMEDAEAAEYMAEFGVSEPALPRFIHSAFAALGLNVFFTAGEQEVRAWPLRRGSNAQQAAGVIHSDLARGFIRAETTAYEDYVQLGGIAGAKAAGKVRLEGKDYIVADGDVMLIRFNV
jgi:GTP-binding protein YchF